MPWPAPVCSASSRPGVDDVLAGGGRVLLLGRHRTRTDSMKGLGQVEEPGWRGEDDVAGVERPGTARSGSPRAPAARPSTARWCPAPPRRARSARQGPSVGHNRAPRSSARGWRRRGRPPRFAPWPARARQWRDRGGWRFHVAGHQGRGNSRRLTRGLPSRRMARAANCGCPGPP